MTQATEIFQKYPQLKDLLHFLQNEIALANRPAHEVYYDDQQAMKLLGVSKRTLQYIKSSRKLSYSRMRTKTLWKLSDLLEFIESGRVEAIIPKLKTK